MWTHKFLACLAPQLTARRPYLSVSPQLTACGHICLQDIKLENPQLGLTHYTKGY
jgi:hypothetical protein